MKRTVKENISPVKFTVLANSPARIVSQYREYAWAKQYQICTEIIKALKSPIRSMIIHPKGKIVDCRYHNATTDTVLATVERSNMLRKNKEFLAQFIRDARLGKTIKKGAKKKVGVLRQQKYAHDLRKLDNHAQKPFDEITQEDMEDFILDLEEGRITKADGTRYAEETQVAIKKIVIKFYKWLNDGHTPELVEWIDTSYSLPDYQAPSKDDIEKMVGLMTSNTSDRMIRNRAIVMTLFDSGMRADELLNVRINHLVEENGTYQVRVEFSKTQKRTISLPFATKYIKEWLDEHPLRNEPLAQLFPLRYQALNMVVKRAGQKIGQEITPHSLRHSSATYWAGRLTQYQLNYRMGWSMDSKQASRYIDRAGLDQERVSMVARTENMNQLQEQNEELHRRLALMEEQMSRFMERDKAEVLKILELVKNQ